MCKPALVCASLLLSFGTCFVHAQNSTSSPQEQLVLADEVPDEELAPAAIQLDTAKLSPLIQALYQVTRETKEPGMVDGLTAAKALIQNGTDLKTTDPQGRTPLHWVVFGSSYINKPRVLVLYEEIANQLIEKGVDVNKQDVYHNTALDYLLYSPNFEIQTLLLENSATSGFLAASSSLVAELEGDETKSPKRVADPWRSSSPKLLPGQTIDIRLAVPVYSDRSRTGDAIEGIVNYPLCKSGELVQCPTGELLLSPGTRVNGTILFAQKAPDKYSRPRLVLDFSNVVHKNGTLSPLYSHVLSVDNARETVRSNEILGIIQPHAKTKASLVMSAIGMVNPIAGYTIRAMQAVYGLSLRREIIYPAGTDLQVQVVRPSRLKEKDAWQGYPRLQSDAELVSMVQGAPMRTHTSSNKLSDVTNLMFLGTREQLVGAFDEAGWFSADELSIRSAAKTVQATIRQANYSSAPVSGLRVNNRLPDLVFQKALNTFAQRHHLRIWKQPGKYNGQEIWVGAATHDIAISTSRASTKWSHRIDPHIDRERDWVSTDLLFVGTAKSYADIDRAKAPRNTQNATGDQIVTDGKMTVVELK